jgi:plastocyanin
MKKVILISFSVATFSCTAFATKHVVTVANFQFTPSNISDVFVGDTIRWEWVSGSFRHTTTCDPATQGPGNSLPDGAPTWDATLNASSPAFEYKVTVAGTYNYWCKPHSPNMAASFTASEALPVKLLSLQLLSSSGKATLNWKTENEENTSYFSIRRSLNGSSFTEIGQVPASGNTGAEKSYSFTDTKISSGQRYYYYNIAVVDKDGRQIFSDTKLFKNNDAIDKLILSLSPNPVSSGHLMMTFNAEKEGIMNVKVINAEGKAMVIAKMQAFPGVNSGHLHLGPLPAGVYSVICTMNGLKESHQIILK